MPGWFVCFLAFETLQWMEPTTSFASFWRRWPSSWTLLLCLDILTWWLWCFFAPKTSLWTKFSKKAAPPCSDLKVISKQAEIFMKGGCFVEGLRKLSVENLVQLSWIEGFPAWCWVFAHDSWWGFKILPFSMLLQQLRYLLQAVMKFHGVGNPSKTPAEATALEMGRGRKATACSWHSLGSYTSNQYHMTIVLPISFISFPNVTVLHSTVWFGLESCRTSGHGDLHVCSSAPNKKRFGGMARQGFSWQ